MVHEKRYEEMYLATPEVNSIDYAALRQKDRTRLDVTVMRGAEYHTATSSQAQAKVTRKQLQRGMKFNVSLLREGKTRDRESDEVRIRELTHGVEELWPTDNDETVEKKWSALRDDLNETARV